jgi:hypothetical protein
MFYTIPWRDQWLPQNPFLQIIVMLLILIVSVIFPANLHKNYEKTNNRTYKNVA